MRFSILIAAICTLVGCSDEADGFDGATPNDFSASFPDSGQGSGKFGCNGYSACMAECLSDPLHTVEGCLIICNKIAKSATISSLWLARYDCAQLYCLGRTDAGSYKCALTGDASMQLVDRPGDPVGTCRACRKDALAGALGVACENMSSPDCNPVSCKGANDDCLADLP